jgi:poly-D-alanine transfer protein DltD
LVLIQIRKQGYKQVKRYADITYSGILGSSNVNRLNEFNLSLANFKDDIIKSYPPTTWILEIPGDSRAGEGF